MNECMVEVAVTCVRCEDQGDMLEVIQGMRTQLQRHYRELRPSPHLERVNYGKDSGMDVPGTHLIMKYQ